MISEKCTYEIWKTGGGGGNDSFPATMAEEIHTWVGRKIFLGAKWTQNSYASHLSWGCNLEMLKECPNVC